MKYKLKPLKFQILLLVGQNKQLCNIDLRCESGAYRVQRGTQKKLSCIVATFVLIGLYEFRARKQCINIWLGVSGGRQSLYTIKPWGLKPLTAEKVSVILEHYQTN